MSEARAYERRPITKGENHSVHTKEGTHVLRKRILGLKIIQEGDPMSRRIHNPMENTSWASLNPNDALWTDEGT